MLGEWGQRWGVCTCLCVYGLAYAALLRVSCVLTLCLFFILREQKKLHTFLLNTEQNHFVTQTTKYRSHLRRGNMGIILCEPFLGTLYKFISH